MDFGLSDEQIDLAAVERSWLAKNSPIAFARPTLGDGSPQIDPAVHRHAAESGLLALLTDDMGGTHVDLAVITEEHGRAASSLSIADVALCAAELARVAVAFEGVASDVAAGESLWVLGLPPRGGTPVRAIRSGDGVHLSGRTAPIAMAPNIDGIVVVAVDDDGDGLLVLVPCDRLEMRALRTLDLTRAWAHAELNITVTAESVGPVDAERLRYLIDATAVHRALDALGAAARLLDDTVAYAKQREQFGAPIGSFQAVKHHCADMAVHVEASRAVLWAGALALDEQSNPTLRGRAASSSVAYACAAASDVASTALQVHGGIGFTWEHDLHVFLRRIEVDKILDGSVSDHRRALVPV